MRHHPLAASRRLGDGCRGQERALDLNEVHIRPLSDAGIGHGRLYRHLDRPELGHGAELFGQEPPGAGNAGDQSLAGPGGDVHLALDDDGHVGREDALGAA